MLMDIETGRQEQEEKQQKTKKAINKDRLITRLILTLGLAGTIACIGASVHTYGNICDASNKYWELSEQKDTYLDTFETSSIFQDTYNAQVSSLKERLISGMINGNDYDKEMKKLNSNSYTEQVLLDNADSKTKNEFNKINEECLQADKKFVNSAFPHCISVLGTVAVPFITLCAYSIDQSTNKYKKQMQEEDEESLSK